MKPVKQIKGQISVFDIIVSHKDDRDFKAGDNVRIANGWHIEGNKSISDYIYGKVTSVASNGWINSDVDGKPFSCHSAVVRKIV